jgi:hypothetical protein
MAPHLTEAERHVLEDLVARFEPVPSSLLEASDDASGGPDAAQAAATDEDLVLLAAKTADGYPIDVMYLLHKALNVEAWRTVSLAERLDVGESLHPFVHAFESWEKALTFHAEQEDIYMTPLLPTSPLARENEASHQRLAHRMAEIRTYLQEVGEEAVVTTRIRRRLFGHVVALRIDQEDHLEEEEELVLPMIRAAGDCAAPPPRAGDGGPDLGRELAHARSHGYGTPDPAGVDRAPGEHAARTAGGMTCVLTAPPQRQPQVRIAWSGCWRTVVP